MKGCLHLGPVAQLSVFPVKNEAACGTSCRLAAGRPCFHHVLHRKRRQQFSCQSLSEAHYSAHTFKYKEANAVGSVVARHGETSASSRPNDQGEGKVPKDGPSAARSENRNLKRPTGVGEGAPRLTRADTGPGRGTRNKQADGPQRQLQKEDGLIVVEGHNDKTAVQKAVNAKVNQV
eukprot:jgi/Botrbrau1/1304/Bobra.0063s0021.1